MNKLLASFCLDNDESIVVRQSPTGQYIGIKLPSRAGYIWTTKAEFQALREGLWLMQERNNTYLTTKLHQEKER